jgi:hypothetical protein
VNRFLIPGALLALALVYPLLVQSLPVYERLGALVLLGAIGASAWNIVGGYAGQVSIGHAVFFGFGAYSSVVVYTHLGWPPIAGAPLGMVLSVLLAAAIGVPTLRLSGHYFSMATIAVGELVRVLSSTSDFLGGAQGLGGPAIPRTVFDLSFLSATPFYYIFLAVLLLLLWLTWMIERGRMGFYLRAIKDSERAARSLLHVRLRRSGVGFRHPDLGQDGGDGRARRCGPALRSAGRGADPGAARGAVQQPAGRPGRRPHLRGLWRDHRDHRPLPAERPAVAARSPQGEPC